MAEVLSLTSAYYLQKVCTGCGSYLRNTQEETGPRYSDFFQDNTVLERDFAMSRYYQCHKESLVRILCSKLRTCSRSNCTEKLRLEDIVVEKKPM